MGAEEGGTTEAGPCSGRHVFCDDFDEGELGSKWDDVVLGAGPLELDSQERVSLPRSLRVTLSAGGGSRSSKLVKALATSTQDVTVAFDLRIDGPTSNTFGAISYAVVDILPAPPGVERHAVQLWQLPGGAGFRYFIDAEDGGGDNRNSPLSTPTLAFGRWQRVSIRVTYAPKARALLSFDGVLAGTIDLIPGTLTGVNIQLGVDTAEAQTTAVVHFDNVSVDER